MQQQKMTNRRKNLIREYIILKLTNEHHCLFFFNIVWHFCYNNVSYYQKSNILILSITKTYILVSAFKKKNMSKFLTLKSILEGIFWTLDVDTHQFKSFLDVRNFGFWTNEKMSIKPRIFLFLKPSGFDQVGKERRDCNCKKFFFSLYIKDYIKNWNLWYKKIWIKLTKIDDKKIRSG